LWEIEGAGTESEKRVPSPLAKGGRRLDPAERGLCLTSIDPRRGQGKREKRIRENKEQKNEKERE